jgi:uncharacterized surface protein with fasciclin (FAS1) repeats
MSNIVEVAVADKSLSTLVRSVKAAGLEDTLSNSGPFTFFAPDNKAFGKLAAGTVEDLIKPENKNKLTGILNYHVINGKIYSRNFVDGQKLKTVNGQELTVQIKDGHVRINGAKIMTRDLEASNGVVHALESVVMPA